MSPPSAGEEPPPARRDRGPRQRTTPRSELSRAPEFEQVSPEVGQLDEEAFDAAAAADPDAALTLLADMATATDEGLRAAARRLAARVVLDRARTGLARSRGVRRLRPVPADRGGDLDVDASLDAVLDARAQGRQPGLDELTARQWGRPELALCLLVDTSGSMGGARLAAAALTAAACALRAPGEHAIVSFARTVTVLRAITSQAPASAVVDSVLTLRGHGTTSLAAGLRAAGEELARSSAERRVVVLLSDCRTSETEDPALVAARLPELVVLAPADDDEEAVALGRRSGARVAALRGVADAPAVLAALLV
ncbi:vWA domain-containing protein [Rhodococcus sp. X156]|uniref:vWA domain-containing protein n=1 Tax=Rhodococcus sp. X156 TaxID=2499145 RepID=UPI001F493EFB|nr:vWA domain-containing protein [Rhodococcus sp. X156]